MIERATAPDIKINLFKIFILSPLYFPSYTPFISTIPKRCKKFY